MTATDSIDSDTREMLKLIVENHPRADAIQCLTEAAFHTVGKYDAQTVLNAIREIRGETYSVDTAPVAEPEESAHDDQSDEGEARLDLGEFYYTPAKRNKKSPERPFGGWPSDPDNKHVYTVNDIPEIDWPMSRWLILGNRDESLLVIDNDSYKLDDDTERERREAWVKQFHGKTTVVKSQSGGDHVYFSYKGNPDDIPPEAEYVDLKGCVNKGCVMVPWGEYKLVSDAPPKHITDDELREMPFFTESEPEPEPEPEPKSESQPRLKQESKPTTPRSELIELETTTDYQDVFDAAVQLLPEHVPTLQSYYESDGTDAENWYPAYRKTESGESLAYWGNGLFLDREENKTAFGTIDLYAAEQEIINRPYDSLEGENWHEAIERARDDGAPIPKYESSGPGKVKPVICEPPAIDPETVDIDERRREIDARYDEYLKNGGISAFADIQSMGKTTTTMWAAADRDRKHAVLFPTHQKAHETLRDDDKPDGYLHLKGPSQPRHDQCMGAECTDNPCPDHGSRTNCPRMCPVYELAPDDTRRKAYDALAAVEGHHRAHKLSGLFDDDSWHNGECHYFVQYDELQQYDRVIGVHEHQCSTELENYDMIIDEASRLMKDKQDWSIANLRQCAKTLEELEFSYKFHHNPSFSTPISLENFSAHPIAQYVRNLIDILAQETEPDLTTLEPPEFYPNLPHTTYGEWLARVKRKYNQTVTQWMKQTVADNTNRWGGEKNLQLLL